MLIAKILIALALLACLFATLNPPVRLGSFGRLISLGTAILVGALLYYIDRTPASTDQASPQPTAPAQEKQIPTAPIVQAASVSKLTGCIAFRTRLNEGLKIFGDVVPPLKWRLEKTQIEGQESYEFENFSEVETGLNCDENGFSGMGTGLYEEGPSPQAKWNSYAKAILIALSSDETPDAIQSKFIQLEKQAISDGQTPACPSNATPNSGSAEIKIGAYKVEYKKTLGKGVQRAHLSVSPDFDSNFLYRPPIETQPRLSCQAVKDALGHGLKTLTKTSILAHLKAEHFQTYGDVEAALLCDGQGHFLGLTTGRGKRDDTRWQEWLDTVARAVKAEPSTFAKARLKSDEEYAQAEVCRPGDAKSGFGLEELPNSSYSVTYNRWDDGEEVSVDP
ncbi:hypothetical protein [Bradyrhizobium diazoefficiens]